MDAYNSLDSALGLPVMFLLGWIKVCSIADYITCLKYVSVFLKFVQRSVSLYNIISMWFFFRLSQFIHTCFLTISFLSSLMFHIILLDSNSSRPVFRFQLFSLIFQSFYPSYTYNTGAHLQCTFPWRRGCSYGSFPSTHYSFIVSMQESQKRGIILTYLQPNPRNGSQWTW